MYSAVCRLQTHGLTDSHRKYFTAGRICSLPTRCTCNSKPDEHATAIDSRMTGVVNSINTVFVFHMPMVRLLAPSEVSNGSQTTGEVLV